MATVLREIIRSLTAINVPPCLQSIRSLGLNGVDFIVPEAEAAAMIVSVAAGEISEESLARWIRDNWPKP
jgi:hypothetical protein